MSPRKRNCKVIGSNLEQSATLTRRRMLALLAGVLLTKGCARRPLTRSVYPLREQLDRELARTKGVGMACAIVGPGKVWWSGGFGLADLGHQRPMLADTLSIAASVSKTV